MIPLSDQLAAVLRAAHGTPSPDVAAHTEALLAAAETIRDAMIAAELDRIGEGKDIDDTRLSAAFDRARTP